MCVHMHACGGQRLMLDVFLYCSSPCFLRQALLLNLELSYLPRLAGQQISRILLSPRCQNWDYKHTSLVSRASVTSALWITIFPTLLIYLWSEVFHNVQGTVKPTNAILSQLMGAGPHFAFPFWPGTHKWIKLACHWVLRICLITLSHGRN